MFKHFGGDTTRVLKGLSLVVDKIVKQSEPGFRDRAEKARYHLTELSKLFYETYSSNRINKDFQENVVHGYDTKSSENNIKSTPNSNAKETEEIVQPDMTNTSIDTSYYSKDPNLTEVTEVKFS